MDKIGRYEIKEKLQKGGMGTVFLAFDPLIKRQVAAKLLPDNLLEPGLSPIIRFTRVYDACFKR